MDERIEHSDDSSAVAPSAFGRREMLQRTGFLAGAAAVAWVAPTVHTVGSRAAAATEDRDSDLCLEAGDQNSGQPNWLAWKFTGGNCSATSTDQEWDETTECSGTDTFDDNKKYDIYIDRKGAGGSNPTSKILNAQVGLVFRYGDDGTNVGSNLTVRIYEAGDDTSPLQTLSDIHTSCSEVLDLLDVFGAIQLVGGQEASFPAIGESGEFNLGRGEIVDRDDPSTTVETPDADTVS